MSEPIMIAIFVVSGLAELVMIEFAGQILTASLHRGLHLHHRIHLCFGVQINSLAQGVLSTQICLNTCRTWFRDLLKGVEKLCRK